MKIFILEELISSYPSSSLIKGAFMTRELAEIAQNKLTRPSWIIDLELEDGSSNEVFATVPRDWVCTNPESPWFSHSCTVSGLERSAQGFYGKSKVRIIYSNGEIVERKARHFLMDHRPFEMDTVTTLGDIAKHYADRLTESMEWQRFNLYETQLEHGATYMLHIKYSADAIFTSLGVYDKHQRIFHDGAWCERLTPDIRYITKVKDPEKRS